mgnify:CR=1 FL=1
MYSDILKRSSVSEGEVHMCCKVWTLCMRFSSALLLPNTSVNSPNTNIQNKFSTVGLNKERQESFETELGKLCINQEGRAEYFMNLIAPKNGIGKSY